MTIAPISSFSLSMGTAMYDRAPPNLTTGFEACSEARSTMWMTCLVRITRSTLHLVKQPDVLDRDHRLVGEGRSELNLLVGERSYRRASHSKNADRYPFAQQGHAECGPVVADPLCVAPL